MSVVEVKEPGKPTIYRCPKSAKKLSWENAAGAKTLYEVFEKSVSSYGDKPFLGTFVNGDYEWKTYKQIADRRTAFGSGLMHLFDEHIKAGYQPTDLIKTFPLGIYSINRKEWVIAEQVCNAYGLVSVALYDTFGPEAVLYIINHSGIPVIVASKAGIPNILKVCHQCPTLKMIVCMDPLLNEDEAARVLKQWASTKNISLYDMQHIEQLGIKHKRKHAPAHPDDLATICYTSGTTGDHPKGALLTHRNCVCAISAMAGANVKLTFDDTHISYLPLAHCFERVLQICCIYGGARIGFYRGDALTLLNDMSILKPTFFASVPRLFNKIYAKVVDSTIKAPGIVGFLFQRAVADKLANLKAGHIKHTFWDALLFNKVAQVLGGKVRFMITASAPISGDVLSMLRVCFSCEVLEAYGATENFGLSTSTQMGDYANGHVGIPHTCAEVKLVDVPDMGYLTTDKPPRGELCIRGPCGFLGYYKDAAKTKEVLDEEGWYLSGDIAIVTETGKIAIIDRKKNILKLAQGEFVAIEKIENLYLSCSLIAQIYIHGDSLQSELVAIVVPEPEKLLAFAKKLQIPADSTANLCLNPVIKEKFLDEMNKTAKGQNLAGFEYVKNIFLESQPFSIENELLTSSLKTKRPKAKEKYLKHIQQLYNERKKSKL